MLFLFRLRCCLNKMLMKSHDGMMEMTKAKSLLDAQRTIQSCLRDLLEKERRPEEMGAMPINQAFRWNMQNPDWRLEDRPAHLGQEFWVFSWINGMRPERMR